MTDTSKDETVVTEDSKTKDATDTTPAVTTEVKSADTGEVEKLRKEKEQAEMRANQLANQLKAKEEAEAKRKAEELEEKQEFKTLYEQKEAELAEIKAEQERKEKQSAIKSAESEALGEYGDEVKNLVKETGLSLTDTDQASIDAFKEKLKKIDASVSKQTVSGNNHKSESTPEYKLGNADGVIEAPVQGAAFDEYVAKHPGMASMMAKNE